MEGIWERREKELNAAITSFWRNYRREERPVEDVRTLDGHDRSDLARSVQDERLRA